jgi:flagellar hook protein FlgE
MMRSMFSAVSGLRNHQTMMDTIASNISNVNTHGFKGQRTTFKDALYQTLSGASAPVAGGVGGTNARQVGLGMSLNSVDQIMTQGTTQSTGVVTDMMINGDGFFRVAATSSTWGGVSTVIGTLSLAKFANQAGLERVGGNMYRESNNSGAPVNGPAGGPGGHGSITPGALEMSNVDLALEFTNMIIAQRGFQANSRAITTSDEMLSELVNLKR